jgi:hypothetical protein
MRLLELFCGTKSVGKVAQDRNWEIISLDFNPKFEATHTEDILTWDYTIYPPHHFDVIWASPDCRTWSIATGGKYRRKDSIFGLDNNYQPDATMGNEMINKVIEILHYFQPPVWYIENPRGLLTYYPPLNQFLEEIGKRGLVYYGNYGHGCPKPTHIWTNMDIWENEITPVMPEDSYIVRLHPYSQKNKRYYKCFYDGSVKNIAEVRSIIPRGLIDRLFNLIEI